LIVPAIPKEVLQLAVVTKSILNTAALHSMIKKDKTNVADNEE
jgi:hypothetical protein